MTANYWVFKVKEETGGLYLRPGADIYNHRMQDAFWSFREIVENEKSNSDIQQLQKDDNVVFYLIESGRESRFLGTALLDSTFEKLDAVKAKKIIHKEYLDFDQGVFLKSINKWVMPLPVDALRGKGAFGDGRAKFGQFFKGSIKKLNGIQEYETIIHEYKELLDFKSTKQKPKKTITTQKKKKWTNRL